MGREGEEEEEEDLRLIPLGGCNIKDKGGGEAETIGGGQPIHDELSEVLLIWNLVDQ
jgi:hypothetical protein